MNQFTTALLLSLFAGLSTVVGYFIFIITKDIKKINIKFFLGLAAGAMIYLSFIELLPESIKNIGFFKSNIFFIIGIIFIAIIDYIAPHHFMSHCSKNKKKHNRLMLTGFMITLAIAIHNFPEGVAVFMSSLNDQRLGILVAFATALHNIPEGVAVAAPIYFATKNKFKSFYYTAIAGFAEPVGAVFAYLLLKPFLSYVFLSYILSIVAGIMVYISFDELLPVCFENNKSHLAVIGIVFGMILMFISLGIV